MIMPSRIAQCVREPRLRRMIFAAAAVFLTLVARPAVGQQRRDLKTETAMKITAPFTVAAVGDIIELRPLYSSDPRFQQLVDRFHNADVGFGNMECSLIDFDHFGGPVIGFEAPIETGDAIKSMGITLVNHANNQALVGGLEGMFSTDRALDKLGIVHAGTGRDLQSARAAAYQEIPKGRVALVGINADDDSYNITKSPATNRDGNLGGAPGVNVLHLTAYRVVTPDQLAQMRSIAGSVYGHAGAAPPASASGPARFKYFDNWFESGPDPGGVDYEINAKDEQDILASIRNGKVYADFLIATIHTHQLTFFSTATNTEIDHKIPGFLVQLAHDAIDAGADMFIAHGVHALRGIEIYKGKPIFYGLSNFIFEYGLQLSGHDTFENEQRVARLENPATNESVQTTTTFEGGRLKEIRLNPVDLGGPHRPISQVGIPLATDGQDAQRTLKEMQDLSSPLGTTISIENNVGVIRVAAGEK